MKVSSSICVLCVLTIIHLAGSLLAQDAQTRVSGSEAELRSWLENMAWHHRFSHLEMAQVTGLSEQQIIERLDRFNISAATRPTRPTDRLLVLPYPGGRHPRIGFLEGAIDPQRETKLSVFAPWDDSSYAVVDIPEAVWSNLGLTYLAHTHIDTVWSKQKIILTKHEWQFVDGNFQSVRRLPNGIEFGVKVCPRDDNLLMRMWLTNGTKEPLSDLRVQNCVMLKGMRDFDQQTNDNKQFTDGYAVASSIHGTRWIISGWDPLHRNWGNERCPCLHSDPKFADCPPGETVWLRGWFSFYAGSDIKGELQRVEATDWRTHCLPE